jgi:hypothetical protein
MAVQDPVFWRHMHEPDDEEPADADALSTTMSAADLPLHKGDPALQRISATLLLAISVWSNAKSGPGISSGGALSASTAPFGGIDDASDSYGPGPGSNPTLLLPAATRSYPTPGGPHAGAPSIQQAGAGSGQPHYLPQPQYLQPPSTRSHPTTRNNASLAPTPLHSGIGGGGVDSNAAPEWDPDEFPRHGEALRRARARLREFRLSNLAPTGPTPREFSSLSPMIRGRLSSRHFDPALTSAGARGGPTPCSPLIAQHNQQQHHGTTDDADLLSARAAQPGRPCDLTAQRLVQDVLMFARGAGMRRLQRRRIENCGGRLSIGHVGSVYVDKEGKPQEFGVAHLPPPNRLGWRRFVQCVCLDSGVALLSTANGRGEVLFAGTFREYTPAPPRGRGSGAALAVASAPTSTTASPAHELPPDMGNAANNMLKVIANNVTDLRGSRARLAALRTDGSLQLLSPGAIRYTAGGIDPFAALSTFAVGQAQDLFFVDDSTRLLSKCAASARAATTPRHATTMLTRAVFTVSAGYHFVVAVDTRGCVWAQGRNEKGQLGVGCAEDLSRIFLPDQALRGRHFVTGVACGRQHTVAVTSSGAVFVAGDNRYGQLGLTPEETGTGSVKGPNTLNRFTRLPLPKPCVGVSCGTFSTFFLLSDGSVLATGNNDFGQLGLEDIASVVSPPQLVTKIARQGGLYGHVTSEHVTTAGKVKPSACCCDCIVA